MHIYKTTNTITGKFYVGKEVGYKNYYLGSGKLLKQAIQKHGKEAFIKETLEHCDTVKQLNQREQYWINKLDALSNQGYNMAPGGSGGDLSKYIDYESRGNQTDNFAGRREWWEGLTKEEQDKWLENNRLAKCKEWYVSRVDDPTETLILGISKWCEEHGIDKSMPTSLNNPKSRLFQKQTKGWRIRRSDMPPLPPYENNRGKVVVDNGCKGRSWKLVEGKRVWTDK